MNEIIEQAAAWLSANPGWRNVLLAAHAAASGTTLAYLLVASILTLGHRGEPRDGWAWERDMVRWTCALPFMAATWPARKLWRWWRGLVAAWKQDKAEHQAAVDDFVAAWDEAGFPRTLEMGATGALATTEELREIAAGIRDGSALNAYGLATKRKPAPEPAKPIAPGAPYGSAPDESGRPVTRGEFDKFATTTGEAVMWHQDWLAGLTDRIAALEAAQKPKWKPSRVYLNEGALWPVFGVIEGVTDESGEPKPGVWLCVAKAVGEPWQPQLRNVEEMDWHTSWRHGARDITAAQKPAQPAAPAPQEYEPAGTSPVAGDRFTNPQWPNGTTETVSCIEGEFVRIAEAPGIMRRISAFTGKAAQLRILKRPPPREPGALIDGARWRAFTRAKPMDGWRELWLVRDGRHVARSARLAGQANSWKRPAEADDGSEFEALRAAPAFAELPAAEVARIVAEAKEANVV